MERGGLPPSLFPLASTYNVYVFAVSVCKRAWIVGRLSETLERHEQGRPEIGHDKTKLLKEGCISTEGWKLVTGRGKRAHHIPTHIPIRSDLDKKKK